MENFKAEIEKLTKEIYSQLGIKNDLFDTTTATGIEKRETYYRLFGHYPENELNINNEKSPD